MFGLRRESRRWRAAGRAAKVDFQISAAPISAQGRRWSGHKGHKDHSSTRWVGDVYISPAGKALTSTGTLVNDGATLLYRAIKRDCDTCKLKPRWCPNMPARKVRRSIHESARDVARDIARTEAYVT